MLQDIAPHVYHNEYAPVPPKGRDVLFDFEDNQLLIHKDGSFFHYEEVPHDRRFLYLFRIDQVSFYLCDLSDQEHALIRKADLRLMKDQTLGFAGITGWSLYDWMKHSQYCGVCGHPMKQDETERAMRCPECGNIVYPRINPAVIIGIINDDGQILATRRINSPRDRWALVAGYVEVGETLEQCVMREAKEETGLDVEDIVYYRSQPWGFSGSLMSGFFCMAHGNQKIIVQKSELAAAEWKNPDDGFAGGRLSLTAEMIHLFRKGEYRKWIATRSSIRYTR